MNKQIGSILAACIVITATAAFGDNKAEQFSVSPIIGGYTFDGKEHLDTNLIYGARAGYNITDNFGIEALFDYVNTELTKSKNKIDMYRYGGELLYHFMPESAFVPYLAVGLSGLNFSASGADKKPHAAFDYGLGAKFFVSDNFALRGDVRHIIYSYSSQTMNNLEYTLGAYIPFGGAVPASKPLEQHAAAPPVSAPAVAQAPVSVAAPIAALKVSPLTVTKGESVTLTWKSLNASGCEIQPGIGRVPPQGVRAITPAASTSYNLSCTGTGGTTTSIADVSVVTPAPAPITSKAAAAAKRFCSRPSVIKIQFDTNKSDIKPNNETDLNNIGEFLKDFPNARGEISGHTDNVASKAYNDRLSQERAENVKKYIVNKFGISADRITTKGYGFSKPVASNKTRSGKAKNRRIETNFSCE